jgi:hypothetical protein
MAPRSPPAPYVCGFIVTVKATVTTAPIFPSILGNTLTISASGMAANPFINFARIFSMPNGVKSTAKYANSIWVYPLLLNANGAPAFSASNPGALPDTSSCIGGTGSVSAAGGPDQVACGSYVMLASTMYGASGSNHSVTIEGVTTTYNNGVVLNPVTPVGITATTPLGIAFRSIAGGNYVQYPTSPGVYGYAVTNLGTNPPTYVTAQSGCIFSYNNLVYKTAAQTWQTTASPHNGEPGFTQNLPWSPLVTHWFYSSYLPDNDPPSQTEITLQAAGPLSLPSVPSDAAQLGGNIGGASTYNATQSSRVPTTCPASTTTNGTTYSNNTSIQMAYPVTGSNNCSLYIGASSSSSYVAPTSGSCYTPGNTPGQQYAAISCQSYGSNYYTFYWNDMGGASSDDYNYADGIIQLGCNGSGEHVTLIN